VGKESGSGEGIADSWACVMVFMPRSLSSGLCWDILLLSLKATVMKHMASFTQSLCHYFISIKFF